MFEKSYIFETARKMSVGFLCVPWTHKEPLLMGTSKDISVAEYAKAHVDTSFPNSLHEDLQKKVLKNECGHKRISVVASVGRLPEGKSQEEMCCLPVVVASDKDGAC